MRASERAYQTLRSDIVEWHLTPGTVLGEVEQAERLGVSRTPVREAFSRLLADGLVGANAGRGVVVAPLSASTVRQLFELRTALDSQAAALAAARGPRRVFEDLAARLDQASAQLAQDDADRSSYYALVAQMDRAIDDAAANTYLRQAQQQLRAHLERVRKLSKGNEVRLRRAAAEHAWIARAIAAGDVDLAQAATRVHLHHSLDAILQTLNPTPRTTDQPDREETEAS